MDVVIAIDLISFVIAFAILLLFIPMPKIESEKNEDLLKSAAEGIPWMNVNLGAINRLNIPVDIQGRVFAARNSFQFFTIPVGYFLAEIGVSLIFRVDKHIWKRE